MTPAKSSGRPSPSVAAPPKAAKQHSLPLGRGFDYHVRLSF